MNIDPVKYVKRSDEGTSIWVELLSRTCIDYVAEQDIDALLHVESSCQDFNMINNRSTILKLLKTSFVFSISCTSAKHLPQFY